MQFFMRRSRCIHDQAIRSGERVWLVHTNPGAMSLHLIESHQARTAAIRKPGGAVSSVFIHAALVAGAFTIASATPVAQAPKIQMVHTAFVSPPLPPPSVNRDAALSDHDGAASAITSRPVRNVPNMNVDIPANIPSINANSAPIDDGATNSHVGSSGKAGNGSGSGSASDILDAPQVDKPVVALGGFHLPRYPETMRIAGVQETVVATFVVDTLGRVETTSISFPAATHTAFAVAVRDALLNARFRPAEANGHLVRQRVAQPFVFTLDR